MRPTHFASTALLGSLFSICVLLVSQTSAAQSPASQQTAQQRAANLVAWVKASQQQLRDYQWMETTTVSHNGKVQSKSEKRCFYGPEGVIQKVAMESSPESTSGLPGLLPPGRLIKMMQEHEKKALATYMQNVQELVHEYIPPAPERLQLAEKNGKLSVQMLDPGHKVQLSFADYLLPGDSLGVQIELPTNRLLGISVSTYLDTADNAVSMDGSMSVLADGTIYVQKTILEAKAKDITVVVENSNYQRVAR